MNVCGFVVCWCVVVCVLFGVLLCFCVFLSFLACVIYAHFGSSRFPLPFFVFIVAVRLVTANVRTYARSSDTPFILSFAIIMLNTDLHRANAGNGKRRRRRMSKEEFINNLR